MQHKPPFTTETARSAVEVINLAREVDAEPVALAGMLVWVSTELVRQCGDASDFLVHAHKLRELADTLDHSVVRQ